MMVRSMVWLLALALTACAAEGGDSRAPGCVPGQMISCSCGDGSPGAAMCDASGLVVGFCACGVSAAGAPAPATPAAGAAAAQPLPQPAATAGAAAPDPMLPEPQPEVEPPPVEPPPEVQPEPQMEPPPEVQPEPEMEPPVVGDGTEVPATEYCAAVADWDPMWTQWEEEVLLLVNENRAQGASCGSEGSFPPAGPLTMNPVLRCSARLHSMDMGTAGYFAHNSLDGRSPFDRMQVAGYAGRAMGENIAKGQQSPQQVMQGWMDSDGHCSNIMLGSYTEIGVGYWEGEADNQFFNGNRLWTQNFGSPGGFGRP